MPRRFRRSTTTSIEKARRWLADNAITLRSRDVSLAKLLDDEAEEIASWLRGLEVVLRREARRTGDPQLVAQLGIYEGIASEVEGIGRGLLARYPRRAEPSVLDDATLLPWKKNAKNYARSATTISRRFALTLTCPSVRFGCLRRSWRDSTGLKPGAFTRPSRPPSQSDGIRCRRGTTGLSSRN